MRERRKRYGEVYKEGTKKTLFTETSHQRHGEGPNREKEANNQTL